MSKYAVIDFSNLKGAFLSAYEGAFPKLWSQSVARVLPVDTEVVNYSDLGAVPSVTEWIGERTSRTPVPILYTISNKVYQTSIDPSVDSVRRNPDLFAPKAEQMGLKM